MQVEKIVYLSTPRNFGLLVTPWQEATVKA
jgi:hypothetical protein